MSLQTPLATALNRESPALARLPLGDLLSNLVTQVNALRADLARHMAVSTRCLTSPVLVIKTAGSALAKTSGACAAVVSGTIVNIAANTDMPALAGTLATTKYALWAFYVDATGTLTISTKTADQDTSAAALAAKPTVPTGKVELGYLIVQNATLGNFTGGTTALDATDITATFTNTSTYHSLLSSPGLAAAAGAKTGRVVNGCAVLIGATRVTIAPTTDLPALSGTIATTKFALWAVYADAAGALSVSSKTSDQTTAAAALAAKPTVPANKVELGYLIVQNATAGNFVGGTTALDATDVTATFTSGPVVTMAAASDLSWPG